MKNNGRTKALSWLLVLAMLFSLVPVASLTAQAASMNVTATSYQSEYKAKGGNVAKDVVRAKLTDEAKNTYTLLQQAATAATAEILIPARQEKAARAAAVFQAILP